jgi:ArsR family transcriptional regulator, lead/cadmium/zinc/bismuth-responsive transcriptional repressor
MARRVAVLGDKPHLGRRQLLAAEQAGGLVVIFKVLANETRLRLLHALVRADELCVSDLAEALNSAPQAISNQLQRLVAQGIVSARRDGNNVYYRIVDPCVPALLDYGWCLGEDAGRRQRRMR